MHARRQFGATLASALVAAGLLVACAAAQDEPERVGSTRSVRVLTAGNQPVPGALVEVWPTMYAAGVGESLRYEADEDGCTRVFVPEGWKALTATKDGIGRSAVVESWRSVVELGRSRKIRGQVLWSDGSPEPGAIVRPVEAEARGERPSLFPVTMDQRPMAVVADAQGCFELDVHPHFDGAVQAESRGVTSPAKPPRWGADSGQPLVLRFAGGFIVTGRVEGPDDLSSARVHAPDVATTGSLSTAVAEDGTFGLLLAEPGTYTVRCELSGWVQDNEIVVDLSEAQPTTAVQLHLVAAAWLAGRVRSESCEPIETVVFAVPDDLWDRDLVHWSRDRWAHEAVEKASSAATDESGAFLIPGLHPHRTYTLFTDLRWRAGVLARHIRPGWGELDLTFER
ncbi:MAG TPA: carboxypeptidase-like regulatory domain-containing protein [Planctomycetota bacterium]|nr:carboxypeptidase-like regulatory domain-containing protein [Planctomycetota bacterium]